MLLLSEGFFFFFPQVPGSDINLIIALVATRSSVFYLLVIMLVAAYVGQAQGDSPMLFSVYPVSISLGHTDFGNLS